jgi:hypothetical protein
VRRWIWRWAVSADLPRAGCEQVLYGSADGFASSGNEVWTQDSSGITSRAEEEDASDSWPAAADFDKSGCADVLSLPGRRTSAHGCWRRCGRNRRLVRSPGCRPKAPGRDGLATCACQFLYSACMRTVLISATQAHALVGPLSPKDQPTA